MEVHVEAARKILEYLSVTAHSGNTFIRKSKLEGVQLEYGIGTNVDADYANSAEDRSSASGVAVCCRGTLVSWFSRMQKSVTLSTTDAEYMAKADEVKAALYVKEVLVFFMPSEGSPSFGVFEDNKGAIDVAKYPLIASHNKNINAMNHVLGEMVGEGYLSVKYVWTEHQHAGILTKRSLGIVLRNTTIFCWGYRSSVVKCFLYFFPRVVSCWSASEGVRCCLA